MLIIFDLDDTLIDTSGCVTHHKLENALQAMVQEGLLLEDFATSLELLRRLDRSSISARAALAEFIEISGIDKIFFEIGVNAVYHTPLSDITVLSLEGAQEVLSELREKHQLALVSMGFFSIQMDKLKKAGIDSQLFSKISITQEQNKKDIYQMIVDELEYPPTHVVVCGDRISLDLTPGRELGYRTVHMKWGRGLYSHGVKGDVDYAISHLRDLKEIVSCLTTFSSF